MKDMGKGFLLNKSETDFEFYFEMKNILSSSDIRESTYVLKSNI